MRYLLFVIMLSALVACGGNTYYKEPTPDQDSLYVWFGKATAAYDAGDGAEAARLYGKVAVVQSTFPGIYYNLGLAHAMTGDTLAAAADFRRHSEMNPTDDAPWRALGHLDMQARRPQEALANYQRALVLAPEQPGNLLGAGRAAYLCGDVQTAIGYLERGRAADMADADIACSLGLLYREVGRQDEGRRMLEEAARLGSREALDFLRQ